MGILQEMMEAQIPKLHSEIRPVHHQLPELTQTLVH